MFPFQSCITIVYLTKKIFMALHFNRQMLVTKMYFNKTISEHNFGKLNLNQIAFVLENTPTFSKKFIILKISCMVFCVLAYILVVTGGQSKYPAIPTWLLRHTRDRPHNTHSTLYSSQGKWRGAFSKLLKQKIQFNWASFKLSHLIWM